VVVNSSQVDDKVLLKSDGMPTYHLAHVVDDIMMDITHVVRGEEWLPSAPAHVLIYKYLGLEEKMPQFAHLPLLLKPDGNGKLSKRDGDRLGFPVFPLQWQDPTTGEVSSGYRERGYIPEAFINMLSLLGWNPGDNREIMSMQELIEAFSFEKVSKAGAKFDPEKTKWFNQQYLRKQSNASLADAFLKDMKVKNVDNPLFANQPYVEGFCALIQEKAHFVNEFWEMGSYFFVAPTAYDEKVVEKRWNESAASFYTNIITAFEGISDFTSVNIESTFKSTAEGLGIAANNYLQLTRVAISGVGGGPQFFDMVALIGKVEVNNRLKSFLSLKNS
jgi:glutamyl-tRNA synthetase